MDSEKLLKKKIEQLLLIPTAASLLLVGMCVVLFLINNKCAINKHPQLIVVTLEQLYHSLFLLRIEKPQTIIDSCISSA